MEGTIHDREKRVGSTRDHAHGSLLLAGMQAVLVPPGIATANRTRISRKHPNIHSLICLAANLRTRRGGSVRCL